MKPWVSSCLASSTAVFLVACGSDDGGSSIATTAGTGGEATVSVAAAFYPLEYLAEQVGGDRVDVVALTPPGTEPHDLELTPDSLVLLEEADLMIYQADFQPAVDDAVGGRTGDSLDLSSVATRVLDEGEGDEAEAEYGGTDPHFWNDPALYADAAAVVAEALTKADPDSAEVYQANVEALTATLMSIDDEASTALEACTIRTLVTAHDAFGYFADRYGFEPVSIAGVNPDAEPSASELAEITEAVRAEGVTTIYTETLVSPEVAETVAAETGAATAVLDPLEGVTDESAGTDYPSIMRANVAAVVAGQDCG